MNLKKWETLGIESNFDLKIFKAEWVLRRNPRTNSKSKFVVLNSKNWVNIIPITTNHEVVMIEQYRHGIDQITLEIPGGLVDNNEEPMAASMRECIEETGYHSDSSPILLGLNHPNPAFLTNSCYSFLWQGVSKKYEQHLDKNEDILVKLIPIEQIKSLIEEQKITHSLVINAFFFYFLKIGLI
jgi:8-oxo-dGTP pyrophosphatase MutT (NUDIX family)